MLEREWLQSERRVENPGIPKEKDQLRLDCWIQIKSTGWDEKKFSAPGSETTSHPLKNPERVRGRKQEA